MALWSRQQICLSFFQLYYLFTIQSGSGERSRCSNYSTSWTVRGSNPNGGEIFRTSPSLGPTQPLYDGYRVIPGAKAAVAWC